MHFLILINSFTDRKTKNNVAKKVNYKNGKNKLQVSVVATPPNNNSNL